MQLASLFQNHAVLQRNMPIPVWGTGSPGESVTITFAATEIKLLVDTSGRWMTHLPPMKEGGPYTLTVVTETESIEVHDLLIGEVWLCSGQSNMAWKLSQLEDASNRPSKSYPEIRLLSVNNPAEIGRANAVVGEWETATPEALENFSAVGGYFGRFLQEDLNVPIGLICNAWGGTRVQAWMSREALMLEPEGRDEIRYYESLPFKQTFDKMGFKDFQSWERQELFRAPENIGLKEGWAAKAFDDTSWKLLELPGYWRDQGYPHNGVFWFRKTISVPENWQGKELEVSLGAIDKHDETWVNGTLVGSMGWETENAWCTPRCYRVASHLVDSDNRITIAVRARSHVYAGGFSGRKDEMWLAPVGTESEDRIDLSGTWQCKVELNWGVPLPPAPLWGTGNPNTPGILFDQRIMPLVPYAIRGVIWYQGESNTSESHLYGRFLSRMIEDWRRVWGEGAFPFIQVQLANYQGTGSWATLREAQLSVLALENTGIAVTIDIGNSRDVHPRNKRDVGFRLAQCALHEAYDKKSVSLSPIFKAMFIQNDGSVRCTFHHTGGKLIAKDAQALRHFTLAGLDRIFHPADAIIDGDTIIVSSPEVSTPYAVRYAWENSPEHCNLYNEANMPVSPFRSDAWSG